MSALLHAGSGFRGAFVSKAAQHTGGDYTAGVFVTWDQENYDIGGWHDNVTNNTRLTVPANVAYVIVSATILTNNHTANKYLFAQIQKGGANFVGAAQQWSQSNTIAASLSLSTAPLAVNAGDYFEVKVWAETDAAIDILVNSSFGIMAIP